MRYKLHSIFFQAIPYKVIWAELLKPVFGFSNNILENQAFLFWRIVNSDKASKQLQATRIARHAAFPLDKAEESGNKKTINQETPTPHSDAGWHLSFQHNDQTLVRTAVPLLRFTVFLLRPEILSWTEHPYPSGSTYFSGCYITNNTAIFCCWHFKSSELLSLVLAPAFAHTGVSSIWGHT